MKPPLIGVIGSGSWGTALVHHLAQRHAVLWYVRDPEKAEHIRRHRRNPSYLNAVELPLQRIRIHSELTPILKKADGLLLVTPSRFLRPILDAIHPRHVRAQWIMSAVKGMIDTPQAAFLISEYLQKQRRWPSERFFVISGPSHAEELVQQKTTFLTVAGLRIEQHRSFFHDLLATAYLQLLYSPDVAGIQYAGILKNVYALIGGIAEGLGMGDNFKAVLMTAAHREMGLLIRRFTNRQPDIFQPAYSGDLLVTGYSRHSRNRAFGLIVGQGTAPRMALRELHMIPEGYFAIEALKKRLGEDLAQFPILHSTYNILYERYGPRLEMRLLTEHLRKLFEQTPPE